MIGPVYRISFVSAWTWARRICAFLLVLSASAYAQRPKGTLMIVGGGPRADDIAQRFVQLAGGAKGKILVFPMASGEAEESGRSSVASWTPMGVPAVNSVLTHDEALRADTAALFKDVTAIWFPGGDQSRLTAALAGTPVLAAIRRRYNGGAVVGGTSAGAAVMSKLMITGDEKRPGGARLDTTQAFITIDRDDIVTSEGFGLIEDAIVDQHFLRRRRHNRLLSLVLENPRLVGVGIDESTAIEVQPDGKWRVWGASAAVIYDARKAVITTSNHPLGARDVQMHILPAGSTYDVKTGRASLPE